MKKRKIMVLIMGYAFHLIAAQTITVQQNCITEWGYQSVKTYKNPFREVVLDMIVTSPQGNEQKIPAFWAGGNTWKFRFAAPYTGIYTFHTVCNDSKNASLHNQSGKIEVVSYNGSNPLFKHGPLKISDNNRHFEHIDGTPFFWLADQWWHGMTTRFRWPEDFQTLTADRKDKGFSVIGFAVAFPCDIEPFDPRGANEAGHAWTDSSFTTINPAYFDLTDLRINHLVSQGIVPHIMGSWGYYIKWAGVDNMKAHYRYLIARYAAYPVAWILAGEVTLAYYPDLRTNWDYYKDQFRTQWSEVGQFLQATDPYDRLITVHPGPGIWDGKPPLYDMDAVDFIFLQSGHHNFKTLPRAISQVNDNLALYPDKPVLHGEVCFEGMQGSSWQDIQRFLFWSNVMSGTAGFSYGVEGIWQFNTEEVRFGASPLGNVWGNVPWETCMHYQGSHQLGLGKQFLEQFEFWKSEVNRDLIKCKKGHSLYTPYTLEIEGKIRISYLPEKLNGREECQIMGLESDKDYDYQFFDPVTGEVYPKQKIHANEQGDFFIPQTPVMHDFVFVLWVD